MPSVISTTDRLSVIAAYITIIEYASHHLVAYL